MALSARGAGVQQSDIKHPSDGRRVGRGKVVQHDARGEALPMDGHSQRFQAERLGFFVVEEMNVARQRQRPRHFIGRVVVAGNDDHGDPSLAKADHLRYEIEAGPVVFPISIVKVAGY